MASISLKYKSKQGNLTAPGDVDPGAMIPIAATTVGSGGAANVTFSSIPQNYEHLQIRGIARSTWSSGGTNRAGFIQFNSDTGSNYTMHQIEADGGSTPAGWGTGNSTYTIWQRITTATAPANVFGGLMIDILDYSNTNKFKTIRALGGNDQNGSGYIYFNSGLWQNTNGITSIKLYPQDENWAQYSSFALYGIKRAGA